MGVVILSERGRGGLQKVADAALMLEAAHWSIFNQIEWSATSVHNYLGDLVIGL